MIGPQGQGKEKERKQTIWHGLKIKKQTRLSLRSASQLIGGEMS